MVTTQENQTPPPTYDTSVIDYVEAAQVPEMFKLCPKEIYVRGHIELLKNKIDEVTADLSFPGVNDSTVIKIIDPLRYFVLTQEQIDEWGIDAVAGEKYLLNGNTRLKVMIHLLNSNKKLIFADVPILEVKLDSLSFHDVVRLQIAYNDTTAKHSSLSKILAIAGLMKRYKQAGLTEKEARTKCIAVTGMSPQYISNANKFIESEDLTDKEIQERNYLFSYVESGFLSVDSAVTIMQISKEMQLEYRFIMERLYDEYGKGSFDNLEGVSRNQINAWRKKFANGGVEPTSKSKNDIYKLGEGDEDDEDLEGENNNLESRGYSSEEVEEAKEVIEDGLRFLGEESEAVKENTSVENANRISAYKSANEKLIKILKEVLNLTQPEDNKEMFLLNTRWLQSTLNNRAVINKIPEKTILNISLKFQSIHQILTKEVSPSFDHNGFNQDVAKAKQGVLTYDPAYDVDDDKGELEPLESVEPVTPGMTMTLNQNDDLNWLETGVPDENF